MGRIVVENLGKKFKIYSRRYGKLLEWLSGDRVVAHEPDWALRGVSFTVEPGESLGIIGMNGAGKSTLLRMLTGTTQASEGRYSIEGRIAALLELGLGIHPEFDGWRNATLSCQLMGLDDATIHAVLPWIHAYSELGHHMGQPVRTYSTGMQVRLAFSIATAVRPDVLIVDEALSVGDAYFQHKSSARIREFKEQGTTLLFVTHDPSAVKALCDRALLLDRGRLLRDGPPDAVFDFYNAMIAQKERDAAIHGIVQTAGEHGGAVTRSGTREAEIVSVELTNVAGERRGGFEVGERARVVCRLRVHRDMPRPTIGFLIRDRLGNDVFGVNTFTLGLPSPPCAAGDELVARFTVKLDVASGTYSVSAALHADREHLDANYDWWDRAALFQVVRGALDFAGVAALEVAAEIAACDPSTAEPAVDGPAAGGSRASSG